MSEYPYDVPAKPTPDPADWRDGKDHLYNVPLPLPAPRDADGPAFSNGTEFEMWQANWCDHCTKEPTCPILLEVLLGDNIPPQLTPGDSYPSDAYHCTEFDGG